MSQRLTNDAAQSAWSTYIHDTYIHTYIRLIITYDTPHSGTMIYAVTLRNIVQSVDMVK